MPVELTTAPVPDHQSPNYAPLVKMERIREIIESVICTGFVESPHTCSIILVGPSGSGKSHSMMQFRNYSSVSLQNELTTMIMSEVLKRDRHNEIKHFLLPDLNPTLSHKSSVVQLFLSSLLTLESEGVFKAGEGTRIERVEHNPVGMITACTPEMYDRHHKRMYNIGLIRRMAPVFYDLCGDTIATAQEEKENGKIHVATILPDRKLQPVRVMIPAPEASSIRHLSSVLATNLGIGPVWYKDGNGKNHVEPGVIGKPLLPLGPHDFLRTLAKGHALKDNRTDVTKDDTDFIAFFVDCTQYGKALSI